MTSFSIGPGKCQWQNSLSNLSVSSEKVRYHWQRYQHNGKIPPSPRWSLPGPEISGPENDQIVWSLSGPGRCLVLLHRGQRAARRASRRKSSLFMIVNFASSLYQAAQKCDQTMILIDPDESLTLEFLRASFSLIHQWDVKKANHWIGAEREAGGIRAQTPSRSPAAPSALQTTNSFNSLSLHSYSQKQKRTHGVVPPAFTKPFGHFSSFEWSEICFSAFWKVKNGGNFLVQSKMLGACWQEASQCR